MPTKGKRMGVEYTIDWDVGRRVGVGRGGEIIDFLFLYPVRSHVNLKVKTDTPVH